VQLSGYVWQDEKGRWNKYGGRLPWGTEAICNNNPVFGGTGNHKTGEDYVAAPNIDHTQEFVRQDIIKWLKLLRSIGFDGFRFDFVKGYSAFHPCLLLAILESFSSLYPLIACKFLATTCMDVRSAAESAVLTCSG
jgi:glycosidase